MPGYFSLFDAAHTAFAIVLLPVIVMLPGYPFAWLLDFAHFRHRPGWQKSLLCLPVSVSVMPVLCYLAGRSLTMRGATGLLAAVCAVGLVLIVKDLVRRAGRNGATAGRLRRPVLAFLLIWSSVVVLSMSDLQIGNRVYPSVVAYDLSFRSYLTGEFARSDMVPPNPFFTDGSTVSLRYHYYWFLYCGLLERLTGGWLAARYVLTAGSVWLAAGVWVLLVLFTRYLSDRRSGRGGRSLIALGLLAVGGLDLLPVLGITVLGVIAGSGNLSLPQPSLEWWTGQQITTWVGQFLWVPNHVASLVACLTGLLLLLPSGCVPERKRWTAAGLGGACLASSVGLSVYVALAFFAFLIAWGIASLLRRQWRQAGRLAAGGTVAALLAVPYASELLASGGSVSAGLLALHVRPFWPWHIAAKILSVEAKGWLIVGDLAMLPVQYFLELGLFFVVLIWGLRRIWRNAAGFRGFDSLALMMVASSFLIGSFLRSVAENQSNDLGWRSFMMAQFVLVLWGADLLALPCRRIAVTVLVALGLAGNVVELVLLRTFMPRLERLLDGNARRAPELSEAYGWLAPVQDLGGRAHDLRQAHEWLNARLPRAARVQYDPGNRNNCLFHFLYSRRAAVLSSEGTARYTGISAQRVQSVRNELDGVFTPPTAPGAGAICGRLGVAAWVVKDTDAVWRDPASWVWRAPAQFRNQRVAVFLCDKMMVRAGEDGSGNPLN